MHNTKTRRKNCIEKEYVWNIPKIFIRKILFNKQFAMDEITSFKNIRHIKLLIVTLKAIYNLYTVQLMTDMN